MLEGTINRNRARGRQQYKCEVNIKKWMNSGQTEYDPLEIHCSQSSFWRWHLLIDHINIERCTETSLQIIPCWSVLVGKSAGGGGGKWKTMLHVARCLIDQHRTETDERL